MSAMNTPEHPPDRTRADRSFDHLVVLADQVATGLLDRTLPKPEWTHEAHILACVSLVRRFGAAEALAVLRAAIPPYNESTGVANTTTGGYHDTITVYYVWAIDLLLAEGFMVAELLAHPLVERTALLAWWDKDVLMSPGARAAWLPPTTRDGDDRRPLEHLQPALLS
jgi:hypothetical protein